MSKKILIIDDEPDIMKMVTYRLKARGYEVFTATKGQEGIELAKTERPDLVILDYRLPDIKAHEVSGQLRANEETKNIPIILATASTENISGKAKECGAVDYITKPIDPEELYAKVGRYIGL